MIMIKVTVTGKRSLPEMTVTYSCHADHQRTH